MFTSLNATDSICSTILVIAFAIFAYFYCKLVSKTNKTNERSFNIDVNFVESITSKENGDTVVKFKSGKEKIV